ncbi:hypothetical protein EN41_17625 [Agrobacterium tumefaciens]|nr:hypothetical protein EN41_17625 [Agrobacterium tumefaciens]WJK74396.1 hypothetical protein QOV31_001279 [Agrobacterium fabrum]CAD0208107.1 hypothetical protein AGTUEHA105_LOCUS870 [Agrobacterium tumefaciens]
MQELHSLSTVKSLRYRVMNRAKVIETLAFFVLQRRVIAHVIMANPSCIVGLYRRPFRLDQRGHPPYLFR